MKRCGSPKSMPEEKLLKSLVSICCYCKKTRDSKGNWRKIAQNTRAGSSILLSHGICPACKDKHFPEYSERILRA